MATDPNRQRVRAGAATAVAQILVMAGSSLLGLLVARRLGSSGETDGFFAANAVYAIALFTAQSLRMTAPATLLAPGPGVLARHLRAVALIGVAVVVLFATVALGAGLLVSDAAVSTFRLALAVLTPAALAQLAAGLLAARCAVLGEFARPASAYAGGTLSMAALFALLVDPLGVDAIAVSVTVGAGISAAAMVAIWRATERRGEAPGDAAATVDTVAPTASPAVATETVVTAPPDAARGASDLVGHFLRGAVPVLAGQALLAVSVFAAGHVASGDGTLYSYGSLAVSVLVAIVAAPVSIVLAPEVARNWDRRPATLVAPTLGSYRLGALLLPMLALPALLWGPWIADVLLTALTGADIGSIFAVAAILAVQVLTTLLSMVPLVACVAAGLLSRVGLGSACVAVAHLVVAPLVAASGSLVALAVEGTLAGIALAIVPIVAALDRSSTRELAAAAATITARYVLLAAATALGVWLALGASLDPGPATLALAAGLAVQVAVALSVGRADMHAILAALLPRRQRRAVP